MRLLGENHEVAGLARADLDLSDGDAVARTLRELEFDVVLTPAALTGVDYCEEHPEEAMAVNAVAPGLIAEVAHEKGARMIHFSTDYVFDGEKPAPLSEADVPNPLGAYGRSKAAGERAVVEVDSKFVVARVSWIFGPDRASFLDSIIRRAMEQDEVAAISDKFSTPSYSHDLSQMVDCLLLEPDFGGLIHLSNSGSCSWQEYGQCGVDAAVEAGLPIKAKRVEGMTLESMGFGAPRPQHTAMSVEKFAQIAGWRPRPWEEAVREFVAENKRSF